MSDVIPKYKEEDILYKNSDIYLDVNVCIVIKGIILLNSNKTSYYFFRQYHSGVGVGDFVHRYPVRYVDKHYKMKLSDKLKQL